MSTSPNPSQTNSISRFIVLLLVFGLSVCSKLSHSQTAKSKPTLISVVKTPFSLDNKGKTTEVYDLIFTHPDGSKDRKGYFANKGEMFHTIVKNETASPITIHWHGLIVPSNQDGVPYVSQLPIGPGQEKRFHFRLLQSGTYWMHSHVGFQEQLMLSAPLIIYEPGEKKEKQQEVIMFLEDFSYQNPKLVFEKLRQAPMKAMNKAPTRADLNDVNYDAFLTNKKTLNQPDIISVDVNRPIRLRIINASSSTNFKIELGALNGHLIAVDGQKIKPVLRHQFPIGVANRLDILLELPKGGGYYPIIAQGEGTRMLSGLVLKSKNAIAKPFNTQANENMGRVKYYELERKLHALNPLPRRKINKRIALVLGGTMKAYKWTINNQSWPKITPNVINFGDRVEIIYKNTTGMSHPMHFHGHVFQVTQIDEQVLQNGAVRDTVLVQPHSTVKVEFDALNPGIWVNHCHNLYHLNAGMLTTIQYQNYPKPNFYLQKIGQLNKPSSKTPAP